MARKKVMRYPFKRGDDFRIDFTVVNTNTPEAIAAELALVQANELLAELQSADPIDQPAIDAQELVVQAAEVAYAAEILMDITGWTITSQIRLNDQLVADLIVDDSLYHLGKFALTLDSSLTQDWRIADHDVDISFDKSDGIVSSDTFIVEVQKDVTRV